MHSENKLKDLIEAYFCSLPAFSDAQKKVIKNRSDAIAKAALQSAGLTHSPKTADEWRRLREELPELLVHVNSPVIFPAYAGTLPAAAALIKLLFSDDPQTFHDLKKARLSHEIYGAHKPTLLRELREYIRLVFEKLIPQIKQLSEPKEIFWVEACIGHFLIYLPFLDPPIEETWQIPLFIQGKWEVIEYSIEKIPLTPPWMGSPVVAYGLRSCQEPAPPLLLFKGTSYPTDEGFALQLLTDVNPIASVGRYLFSKGSASLRTWLSRSVHEAKGTKVRVFGISLGGALTEHTVVAFHRWIEVAYAYNPPALFHYELTSWSRLYRQNPNELPKVYIFQNEKDLVPYAGSSLGDGWKVFRLIPETPPSILPAHFKNFLARPEQIILSVKNRPENRTFMQRVVSWLHLLISIPLFVLGALIYFLTRVFEKLRKSIQ
jgi:hypothetical protein